MLPIVLSYPHGASGHFIAACINAVRINNLSDIQVSAYGEYIHNQYSIHKILSIDNPVKMQDINLDTICTTHSDDIAELLRTFSIVLTVTENAPGDIVVAYMNGISKFTLGNSSRSITHQKVVRTKKEIHQFLFSHLVNEKSAQLQFSLLPEIKQRDILMWGCMKIKSDLNFNGYMDPILPLNGEYQLPYSCIRYGRTDVFVEFVNQFIQLNSATEEFVRRNFNNYYSKQNHLMMHDPENYMRQVEEKARLFLNQFK